MSKSGINTGIAPNDGNGDSLLAGAIKINDNFNEIYDYFGDGTNLDFTIFSGQQLNISGISTLGITSISQLRVSGISTLGITSISQLGVSGISTLGVTSTTNLTSQQLNVSGISTLGITSTTNLTSQQLNISGISTLGITSISQLTVTGVSTLGITSTTNLTSQQLNISGISTLGVTSTTNLTSQQLNVSGISTLGDTSTTNLTSQQLNVSGVGTIGTVRIISGIVTATSGIVTYYGSVEAENINVKPGTDSTSPIKLNSGTNLTVAQSGAVEYDGTSFYLTPNTSFGRSIIPTTIYATGIGSTGVTQNITYPLFLETNDTITLPVGSYLFTLRILALVGTTVASTFGINIKGSGSSDGTFNWNGIGSTANPGVSSSFYYSSVGIGTTITVTPSSNLATRQYGVSGQGILRITSAGTIIPSYSYPVTITSGITTLSSDNYMIIQSLNTQSSATFLGNWS